MKYNMIKNAGVVLAFGLCATSCNDFLDEKPTSNIFPDVYFSDASHLEAYANNLYVDFLPSHTTAADYGIHGKDKDTDNQAARGSSSRYTLDRWMVSQQNTSDDIILIISVNVTTFWNKSYLSMKQEPSEEMRWMLSNI